MAELDVQPKRSKPWWLWLLLLLIAIAILLFLFKGCGKGKTTTTITSTSTNDTTANGGGKEAVAVTQPDFSSVNFNSPKSSDPDVTDKDISVSGNNKYTIYTLGENILFAKDQNTVQQSAEQKLKQIVASLNKRFKGAAIGVFGNTDSTGTASHNKQLGAQRAAAVKAWLVKSGGMDDSKVSIHSFGETQPVANNSTASGRKENRNVEIVAFPDTLSGKK